MKKIRTFVAVETGAAVRKAALQLIDQLRSCPAEVKWVERENMHITLQFLGDVDAREIHHVCEVVQRAVAELAPFELEIRGAGAFPNPARPGTVWLGTGQGAKEMDVLQQSIDKALQKLGFRPEARRFHAHLTLGRVRRGGPGVESLGEAIGQHADCVAGRMTVREVTVFSSQLRPEGPVYEAMGTARLSGSRGS
jgi:2'-5' RNA ligase